MRLGIMQPYPFPYIGYFELMASVDRWIAFDIAQYNRHSWMNRNRILHPAEGWQYFVIPVRKAPHGTRLADMVVSDLRETERRLVAQLDHYRGRAPHHGAVIEIVRETFSRTRSDALVTLSLASLAVVAERLAIPFAPERCSSLGLELDDVEHAGQWALRIASGLGASEYLNPPGGRALFRTDEWQAAQIRLSFTRMNQLTYNCGPYTFQESLSILDVLMWCSVDETSAYLCKQRMENTHHAEQ